MVTREIAEACQPTRSGRRGLWMNFTWSLELLGRSPQDIHVRLALVHFLLRMFPPNIALRLRSLAYRLIGFNVARTAAITGNLSFNASGDFYPRLTIEEGCVISTPVFLDLNAPVRIGKRATLSRHTVVLTDTHEIGPSHRRMGKMTSYPVAIEDGAWVCAGCLILPGVTIGRGSVVSAGSVVTKDVPPNTMVAGAPARVVRHLPEGPLELNEATPSGTREG